MDHHCADLTHDFFDGDNLPLAVPAPGETLVKRYSPGYGDFPLEAQRELLALIDAPRKVGVWLTDSLLMVPSKSGSAMIGVKIPAW